MMIPPVGIIFDILTGVLKIVFHEVRKEEGKYYMERETNPLTSYFKVYKFLSNVYKFFDFVDSKLLHFV